MQIYDYLIWTSHGNLPESFAHRQNVHNMIGVVWSIIIYYSKHHCLCASALVFNFLTISMTIHHYVPSSRSAHGRESVEAAGCQCLDNIV
jgi:hypothetical protein